MKGVWSKGKRDKKIAKTLKGNLEAKRIGEWFGVIKSGQNIVPEPPRQAPPKGSQSVVDQTWRRYIKKQDA